MHEFKRSLTALIGILILVGIVTFALPRNARSANATSSSAPTTQTQNVNVVNTPTVTAQQSGPWNVGINGTPTVAVSNFPTTTSVGIDGSANTVKVDTTNPLPVQDVDNPARHPFAFLSVREGADLNQLPTALFSVHVPDHQRLVIEQVSVLGFVKHSDFQALRVEVEAQANGNFSAYHVAGVKMPASLVLDQSIASSQLRLYADPGTDVSIIVFRNDSSGLDDKVEVDLSGYLIDLP